MNADEGEARTDPREYLRKQRGDLERLIRWYFGAADASYAIYVAWQMSGMDPLAFHRYGRGGVGLYQIDPAWVGLAEQETWLLQNPIRNVAWAHKLWSRDGWAKWQLGAIPALWDSADEGGM